MNEMERAAASALSTRLQGQSALSRHLRERLAAAERWQRCLLLDVSGSMSESIEPGRSKYEALQEVAAQFPGERKFAFASHCQEIQANMSLPMPGGGTDMAAAFRVLKTRNVKHAAIVTDGIPDDAAAALREAKGLRLDIFYVGPYPSPKFLQDLSLASDGQFRAADLRETKQLTQAIKGLLKGGK